MKCSCSLTPVLALVGLAGLGFGGYNLMFGNCGSCTTESANVAAASLESTKTSECGASKGACDSGMIAATDESVFFETVSMDTAKTDACTEMKECAGKNMSECPAMKDCSGAAASECHKKSDGTTVASKDQGDKSKN